MTIKDLGYRVLGFAKGPGRFKMGLCLPAPAPLYPEIAFRGGLEIVDDRWEKRIK
jgi:hypothetical protein